MLFRSEMGQKGQRDPPKTQLTICARNSHKAHPDPRQPQGLFVMDTYTHRSLTPSDKRILHNILEKRLFKRNDGTDRWIYEPGWTDERVLQESGVDCVISQLWNFRVEEFGHIRHYGRRNPTSEKFMATVTSEQDIKSLRFQEIIDNFNTLNEKLDRLLALWEK